MTTPYLDLAGFRAQTLMPGSYVDELEAEAPGWVLLQLTSYSRRMDGQLSKRYAAPFELPYPEVVTEWLTRLVTHRAFLKRGIDPDDPQAASYLEDATSAKAEIEAASNSETGLWDLPLRADTSASGISKGGPFGYSEASPYAWTDVQARTGREEDAAGSGTHG